MRDYRAQVARADYVKHARCRIHNVRAASLKHAEPAAGYLLAANAGVCSKPHNPIGSISLRLYPPSVLPIPPWHPDAGARPLE